MILARLCLNNEWNFKGYIVTIISVGIYILHIMHKPITDIFGYTWWINVIDIVSCSLFIIVLAKGEGKLIKFLSAPKMIKLGSVAMFIYLFHYPVISWVDFIRNKFFVSPITDSAGIIELIAIIIFTGVLTYISSLVSVKLRKRV